ncbi:MAG: hypothetical protein IJX08_06260 [Clostridia bacterium]|nr:hypothetical protein [Clostridia bacterium]
MAKLTIPKEFGYPSIDVWVNGKKYTYATGELIYVPDEVAEVLQAKYSAIPVPKKEPPFGKLVVNAVVNSSYEITADKTHEEIEQAIKEGVEVVCLVDYNGTTIGNVTHCTLVLSMTCAALDNSPKPICFSGRAFAQSVDVTVFSDGHWEITVV